MSIAYLKFKERGEASAATGRTGWALLEVGLGMVVVSIISRVLKMEHKIDNCVAIKDHESLSYKTAERQAPHQARGS